MLDLVDGLAVLLQETVNVVGFEPFLEHREFVFVGLDVGQGNLMRSEGSFDELSVEFFRSAPSL